MCLSILWNTAFKYILKNASVSGWKTNAEKSDFLHSEISQRDRDRQITETSRETVPKGRR